MFTHLRQTAQGFFAKVILFFLTAMFVLWGVGDVFRTMGSGQEPIVTVGKHAISPVEFHNALRRGGKPQEVLAALVRESLFRQDAAALGIVVSDDEVVNYIGNLREFQDKDGRYDKALYRRMLANAQTDEAHFIEDIRHEIAVKLIVGAYTGWIQVPEDMVTELYKIQEEQRAVNFYSIPASFSAGRVAPPTESEIKAFYDAHTKEFMAPEYRTFTYLTLPLTEVQKTIAVPADQIRQTYDDHKENYRQPEKRLVDDLQFDNQQDANETYKKLSPASAQGLAAAPVTNKGKTSLGLISMQEVPPEARSAVFGLAEGGVTSPQLINFVWHVYHVEKIVPDRLDTFEEARPVIASELAARGAQETAVKLINAFEDTLAGGASLDKAAEKIGQKIQSLGPVTRSGLLPDGSKAVLPPYANFLNSAFSVAQGERSQAVQTPDGSYFIVQVDNVQPEHVRPLADVREQASRMLETQKAQDALQKAMENLSEQLQKGKKPADALAAIGVVSPPAASAGIRRAVETIPEGPLKGKPIPRGLVGEIFSSAPGKSTHAYPSEGGGYLIASVLQVSPAPAKPDPKALDEIRESLKATLADEIMHQYLRHLRGLYPITVNNAALGAVMKNEVSDEAGGE